MSDDTYTFSLDPDTIEDVRKIRKYPDMKISITATPETTIEEIIEAVKAIEDAESRRQPLQQPDVVTIGQLLKTVVGWEKGKRNPAYKSNVGNVSVDITGE